MPPPTPGACKQSPTPAPLDLPSPSYIPPHQLLIQYSKYHGEGPPPSGGLHPPRTCAVPMPIPLPHASHQPPPARPLCCPLYNPSPGPTSCVLHVPVPVRQTSQAAPNQRDTLMHVGGGGGVPDRPPPKPEKNFLSGKLKVKYSAKNETPILGTHTPPPPPCDIPSGCCSFTGPWTVTRSSLCMLRQVAAFCRPLRPVLLLVSFPRSRSPVVGVLGLC